MYSNNKQSPHELDPSTNGGRFVELLKVNAEQVGKKKLLKELDQGGVKQLSQIDKSTIEWAGRLAESLDSLEATNETRLIPEGFDFCYGPRILTTQEYEPDSYASHRDLMLFPGDTSKKRAYNVLTIGRSSFVDSWEHKDSFRRDLKQTALGMTLLGIDANNLKELITTDDRGWPNEEGAVMSSIPSGGVNGGQIVMATREYNLPTAECFELERYTQLTPYVSIVQQVNTREIHRRYSGSSFHSFDAGIKYRRPNQT